jgi:hypothetical protein
MPQVLIDVIDKGLLDLWIDAQLFHIFDILIYELIRWAHHADAYEVAAGKGHEACDNVSRPGLDKTVRGYKYIGELRRHTKSPND